MAVERDLYQHRIGQIERLRVDAHRVALDHPGLLHLLRCAQHGEGLSPTACPISCRLARASACSTARIFSVNLVHGSHYLPQTPNQKIFLFYSKFEDKTENKTGRSVPILTASRRSYRSRPNCQGPGWLPPARGARHLGAHGTAKADCAVAQATESTLTSTNPMLWGATEARHNGPETGAPPWLRLTTGDTRR